MLGRHIHPQNHRVYRNHTNASTGPQVRPLHCPQRISDLDSATPVNDRRFKRKHSPDQLRGRISQMVTQVYPTFRCVITFDESFSAVPG